MNQDNLIFFEGTAPEFAMIKVKGGNFTMHETQKKFTLNDYYLGETPVTQALWEYVMDGHNPAFFKGKQRPVECVSWYDAAIFCNALSEKMDKTTYFYADEALKMPLGRQKGSYLIPDEKQDREIPVFFDAKAKGFRLPKEAEWEFAAIERRAQYDEKQALYAGGNNLELLGWYDANSHQESKEVKLKMPNSLGLYDMSSNIREWCEDFYDNSTSDRVERGGSCYEHARYCVPSSRKDYWQDHRSGITGFRLAFSFLV